jgi:hypothetical protein
MVWTPRAAPRLLAAAVAFLPLAAAAGAGKGLRAQQPAANAPGAVGA